HGTDARTHLLDHARAFVTAEQREVVKAGNAHRLHHRREIRGGNHVTRGEMVIGVADARVGHLHQYFALARRVEGDLLDVPVPTNTANDRALAFHRTPPRGLRPTRRTPCATVARIRPSANRNFRRE